MNKEIEDKVKELSRRIVGTGQIVVTAESSYRRHDQCGAHVDSRRERMVRKRLRDLYQSGEARDAGCSAVDS